MRPGGASDIVMRSPEGQEFPNREEHERLDFREGWTAATQQLTEWAITL